MSDREVKVSKADIVPHAHYMRPLDGIRGMACMIVVASHISMILHLFEKELSDYIGMFGVILFFVLSGFLMSALYTDARFTADKVVKYSIARFARIAPAYWIAVIFAWVLYLNIPDFHYSMTPWHLLRSVVFGGNQGVFWSIPPEVQFYGFFLLLWFAWSRFKEGSKLWLILMAVLCVGLVATKDMWGGLMLPSKLHIFLSGFFAAFLPRIEKVRAIIHSVRFQIFMTILTLTYALTITVHIGLYKDLLFPVLAGLWVAAMSGSTKFTAPLETNTMRMVGAASFSIYLFHDATLYAMRDMGWFTVEPQMLNIALMVLLSLAPPVAFHFIMEKKLNLWSKTKLLAVWKGIQEKQPKFKASLTG
jgi:peptidoglycan/LPS O-acetylase OafA/YrhL